jgi:hypothetical protein
VLAEGSGHLAVNAIENVAVVVDASESAKGQKEVILELALRYLDGLPANVERKLYFLSNPEALDAASLPQNAEVWWRQKGRRGSFITPILERVKDSRVVVIGSGPIHDLEDWKDDKVMSRLVLVKTDESLRSGVESCHEVEPTQMVEPEPIVSVEITGEDFMPYYWTNTGYSLSVGEKAALSASDLEDFSLSLRFFGTRVRARIKRRRGEEEIPLESSGIEVQQEWKTLRVEEGQVLGAAVRGDNFTCLVCGKEHPPSAVKCCDSSQSGSVSVLGLRLPVVYPSLKNDKGFVVFRETHEKGLYRVHPVNVIRIAMGRVAVVLHNRPSVFDYETSQRKWIERGQLTSYHRLEGENQYVVFL